MALRAVTLVAAAFGAMAAAGSTATTTGSDALFELLQFEIDMLHDFHLLSFVAQASGRFPRLETPVPKHVRWSRRKTGGPQRAAFPQNLCELCQGDPSTLR